MGRISGPIQGGSKAFGQRRPRLWRQEAPDHEDAVAISNMKMRVRGGWCFQLDANESGRQIGSLVFFAALLMPKPETVRIDADIGHLLLRPKAEFEGEPDRQHVQSEKPGNRPCAHRCIEDTACKAEQPDYGYDNKKGTPAKRSVWAQGFIEIEGLDLIAHTGEYNQSGHQDEATLRRAHRALQHKL